MSGTLAVEARRGSLDFIAAGPFGKRRIALEKLGAYLTTMLGVMAVLALTAWLDGVVFYSLPGDQISLASAVGFALWVGLLGIVSGAVAFALAPFIGRGGAAALAGLVMVLGFLLNGYQGAVPAFSSVAWLSWFSWASQNVPLAGQFDWPSLVLVAAAALVLMAVGVEAFARRDLGVTSSIPTPGRPADHPRPAEPGRPRLRRGPGPGRRLGVGDRDLRPAHERLQPIPVGRDGELVRRRRSRSSRTSSRTSTSRPPAASCSCCSWDTASSSSASRR